MSLAAALSLTGAAWAEHGGEGGHGPGGGHGTTPTFASHGVSHSGVRNSAATRGDSDSDGRHSNSASRESMNFVTRITNDPTLSARLLALMPSGTTMMQLIAAAKGFRNQGQFIAALHAAKDLGISFTDLKAEMTGSDHDSLGQAIHELKPTLDATTVKQDVTIARQEAKADVQAARAAKEAAEDAKEAAKEKAEDAKEATKEAAEEAMKPPRARLAAPRLAVPRRAVRPDLELTKIFRIDLSSAAGGRRHIPQVHAIEKGRLQRRLPQADPEGRRQ